MFDVDACTAEVARLVQAHLNDLSRLTGQPIQSVPQEAYIQRVALLCDAANGELGECRDDAVDEAVSDAWDDVFALLTSSAYSDANEPDTAFWQSPLGALLMHARLWLDCDSLLTLSDAATILRGAANDTALRHINYLISAGKLTKYTDSGEPNPQRAGRVSRSQVEALQHGQSK